jgi:hypothetical protein
MKLFFELKVAKYDEDTISCLVMAGLVAGQASNFERIPGSTYSRTIMKSKQLECRELLPRMYSNTDLKLNTQFHIVPEFIVHGFENKVFLPPNY